MPSRDYKPVEDGFAVRTCAGHHNCITVVAAARLIERDVLVVIPCEVARKNRLVRLEVARFALRLVASEAAEERNARLEIEACRAIAGCDLLPLIRAVRAGRDPDLAALGCRLERVLKGHERIGP